MSHTPTPWEYHTENRGHYLVTRSYPKLEGKVVVVNEQSFDSEDDVFRIVACVNACDGMKDPAKEIQALKVFKETFDELSPKMKLASENALDEREAHLTEIQALKARVEELEESTNKLIKRVRENQ